ncbi:DUF6879 family protein [Streptomyces niveus]
MASPSPQRRTHGNISRTETTRLRAGPSGTSWCLEHELTTDPEVVKLCASAFERVWESGTAHEGYRPR